MIDLTTMTINERREFFSLDSLRAMGREELLDVRDDLLSMVCDIQSQVDSAESARESDGILPDLHWLTRAKTAIRYRRLWLQRVERVAAQKRPQKPKGAEWLTAFIDLVSDEIGSKRAVELLQDAKCYGN